MPLIRCTRPPCRSSFEVAPDRLGRNVDCPACGHRITAVPAVPDDGPPQRRARPRLPPLPLEALLDDVRSLWNVGSMFRTADGAGMRHLYLTGITGYPPRKEISKTALGADEHVAWSHHRDPVACAVRLRDQRRLLLALETTPTSLEYDRLTLPALGPDGDYDAVCLVVGNEVAGVAPALLELAPVHIALPMRGVKDSLNAAVAFGVAGFALAGALAGRR